MKINIWDDCWIPSSSSRKIIMPRGNRILSRVNELIDPISGTWDEVLIRDNFWDIDAERILQIPIFQHETEDFVAWHLTKSGTFSVRSAYYKQWEDSYLPNSVDGKAAGGSAPHPVWNRLWDLKVPGKVKIFLWRCLHNAIPCMCVLANRHISTSGQCPICHTHAEDVEHMLIKCTRANQIWRCLGLHEIIDSPHDPLRSGASWYYAILCTRGIIWALLIYRRWWQYHAGTSGGNDD